MAHTYDAIDDGIDLLLNWERVLAIVRSTTFTDNERVAFVFYFLGYSTNDMARYITKEDGTPISRERGRQLVRSGLKKIFATCAAGEPPPLTAFFPHGEQVSRRQEGDGDAGTPDYA